MSRTRRAPHPRTRHNLVCLRARYQLELSGEAYCLPLYAELLLFALRDQFISSAINMFMVLRRMQRELSRRAVPRSPPAVAKASGLGAWRLAVVALSSVSTF